MYLLYAVTAKSSYWKKKKKIFLMLCTRWFLGLWNSLYPLAVTWHSACQYLWFILYLLWDASNIKQMLFVSVYDTVCFCFLLIGDWQLACDHLHCVLLKTLQWRKRQINWHNNFVRNRGTDHTSKYEWFKLLLKRKINQSAFWSVIFQHFISVNHGGWLLTVLPNKYFTCRFQ